MLFLFMQPHLVVLAVELVKSNCQASAHNLSEWKRSQQESQRCRVMTWIGSVLPMQSILDLAVFCRNAIRWEVHGQSRTQPVAYSGLRRGFNLCCKWHRSKTLKLVPGVLLRKLTSHFSAHCLRCASYKRNAQAIMSTSGTGVNVMLLANSCMQQQMRLHSRENLLNRWCTLFFTLCNFFQIPLKQPP